MKIRVASSLLQHDLRSRRARYAHAGKEIFMIGKRMTALLMTTLLLWLAAGCATNPSGTEGKVPGAQATEPGASGQPGRNVKLPEKLRMGENGEPVLKVYVQSKKKLEEMPLEAYLEGVLAGEMKNDWPVEALKAQAILARTFVLKFLEEKTSKYPGADISTDIEEAQAYDETGINDRIREAVSATEGMVLSAQGTLPFAWFHAHSGGITAMAKEGLEYEKAEPPYIHSVKGRESSKAPEDAAHWTATFSAAEIMKAASRLGASGTTLSDITIGERGESGRATTLIINGASVPAASFRIALGSTEMKSTLLQELKLSGNSVTMEGKGYGHGVGMSQWGAYGMAEQGEKAEAIVGYYFKDVQVVKAW